MACVLYTVRVITNTSYSLFQVQDGSPSNVRLVSVDGKPTKILYMMVIIYTTFQFISTKVDKEV